MLDHGIFLTVLSITIFLFLSAIVSIFSEKIRIPFTLLLVLFGCGIFFGVSEAQNLFPTFFDSENFFAEFLPFFGNFRLSPEIVFYLFLPTLVFESAFHLRFSEVRQNLTSISVLAIVSLLVSAGIIATGLHLLFHIPLLVAFLFGIIISATDPVAVLALFKEVGAPRRLRTIIEGESLFNDGTSLVFFKIITGVLFSVMVIPGNHLLIGAENFLITVFGGALFGIFTGFFFSESIGRVRNKPNVEMTLTLILAHFTFLLAEHLGLSGIIATVAAGLVLGNYGRHKISPSVLETMHHFWDHLSFIVNSLIFLLIGIAIANSARFEFWLPSLAAVGLVIVARFLSVVPILSALNLFSKKSNQTPFSWQVIISHGGLRGALAVVMVLLLPREFEYRELFETMTVSVIIFFFLTNATTIGWLLKKFGLMDFTPVDTLEIEESHVLVSHAMRDHLTKIHQKNYVDFEVFQKTLEHYREAEEKAAQKITALFRQKKIFSEKELLLILKKHCLGVERKVFHQLFAAEEISESTLVELSSSVERQRDRLFLGFDQEKKRSREPFLKRISRQEKIFKDFFWFLPSVRIIEKWRRKKILEKHERYRARRISAWNVLKHLEDLEHNDLFTEGNALEKVRKLYEKWHENARSRQFSLEATFSELLQQRKFYLAKRNCLNLEKLLLEDLSDRGIITARVFSELSKSIEYRVKKIRKNPLSEI